MNNDKNRKPDLDQLIRSILADDLPVEVQTRMLHRVERFRHEVKDLSDRPRSRAPAQAASWFRKELLAAASLMLIAMGGFWQVAGFRNPLTDRLIVLGIYNRVRAQAQAASVMTCQVRTPHSRKDKRAFYFTWRSPDFLEYQIRKPDGAGSEGSMRLSTESSVFIQSAAPAEPFIPIELSVDAPHGIAAFFSPVHLMNRLAGRWEESTAGLSGSDRLYLISFPEKDRVLEVTVDHVTWLPSRVRERLTRPVGSGSEEASGWDARIQWDKPDLPQRRHP